MLFYPQVLSLLVLEFYCIKKEDRGYPIMTRDERFLLFCHGLLGVYLLSEVFIAADCTQFAVMTIMTNIYIYILFGHVICYGFSVMFNRI